MPTWTDQVQAASSVAGVIIAIIGFIFVSYQIRQINRSNRGGAHATIFTHYLEVTGLMLDHPEVRPYLYDGKKLKDDDPNRDQVLLACEVFGDFFEHVALQRENLPKDSLDCWDKAIADRFMKNPTLNSFLSDRRHVYAPALFEAIERGRLILDNKKASCIQIGVANTPVVSH